MTTIEYVIIALYFAAVLISFNRSFIGDLIGDLIVD